MDQKQMRSNMNKLFLALPLIGVLAACGTTDPYEKRAVAERERNDKAVERSVDRAPKWMTKLPESKDAVYANGTAVSRDFAMAGEKAKVVALSRICMAAGGEVDKNSKVYMSDTESVSTESSETAIRSMCRRVDVTGVEVVETVHLAENGRFRTYILLSLPLGEANKLQERKDRIRAGENARKQSEKSFKELDNQ
jgi:hypothetical protein